MTQIDYMYPVYLNEYISKFDIDFGITSVQGFSWHHYFLSFYLGVQIFTLTGLGDLPLRELTDLASFLLVVILLVNIWHSLYIIGQITGSFIEVDYLWLARKQLATYIKAFLRKRAVPWTLIQEILKCQELNLNTQKFLLSQMAPFECIDSPTLINLAYSRYQHVLAKLDLLDYFSIDEMYFLTMQFDEVILPKGQCFLEKGELVDSLYIILHGSLRISAQAEYTDAQPRSTLKDADIDTTNSRTCSRSRTKNSRRKGKEETLPPASCIGILNKLTNHLRLENWLCNLIASVDTTLLILSPSALNVLVKEKPEIASHLFAKSKSTYNKIVHISAFLSQKPSDNNQTEMPNAEKQKEKGKCSTWKTERYIFHPKSTSINVILIILTLAHTAVLSAILGNLAKRSDRWRHLDGFPDGDELDISKSDTDQYVFATLSSVFHLVYFLLQFHTGYFDKATRFMILDPEMIWKRCMKPASFLYNVMCIMPNGYMTTYDVADFLG